MSLILSAALLDRQNLSSCQLLSSKIMKILYFLPAFALCFAFTEALKCMSGMKSEGRDTLQEVTCPVGDGCMSYICAIRGREDETAACAMNTDSAKRSCQSAEQACNSAGGSGTCDICEGNMCNGNGAVKNVMSKLFFCLTVFLGIFCL